MQAAFGFSLSVMVVLPKILAASASQIGVVMGAFGLASLLSIPFMARAMVAFDHRGSLIASNLISAVGALGWAPPIGTRGRAWSGWRTDR